MKKTNFLKWVKYFSLPTLAICLTVFVACQKDIVNMPATEMENKDAVQSSSTDAGALKEVRSLYPSIKKGRLAFANQESFTAYMKALNKLKIEEVEQLSKEKGFVSHLEASQKEQKATNTTNGVQLRGEEEESTKWIIPDAHFASTLNEEREVGIGEGIICKAGNDFSFMYEESRGYLVENFYRDYQSGMVSVPEEGLYYADNQLYVYPTGMISPDDKGVQLRSVGHSKLVRKSETFDGTWRLYGEHWQGSWIVWASSGVKTECQKVACTFFNRICWYSFKNASKLGLKWNAKLYDSNPAFLITNEGNRVESNVSRVQERFDTASGQFSFYITLHGGDLKKIYIKPAKLNFKIKEGKSTHTGTLNNVSRTVILTW